MCWEFTCVFARHVLSRAVVVLILPANLTVRVDSVSHVQGRVQCTCAVKFPFNGVTITTSIWRKVAGKRGQCVACMAAIKQAHKHKDLLGFRFQVKFYYLYMSRGITRKADRVGAALAHRYDRLVYTIGRAVPVSVTRSRYIPAFYWRPSHQISWP